WYLRNWAVAGSPIYPASLTLAGRTLARGAFTHAAMTNSIFHITDFRVFAFVASTAFGGTLFLFWIPVAVVGIAGLLTKSRSWLARLLMLLPVLMVPLYWFGVPDNTDPRYLFPIVALALLPFAFAFQQNPKWNRAVHIVHGIGLLWLIVGMDGNLRMHIAGMPYYMEGGVSLRGLVALRFLPLFVLLGLGGAYLCRRLLDGHLLGRTTLALSTACALVGIGSLAACPPEGCALLDLTRSYIHATV